MRVVEHVDVFVGFVFFLPVFCVLMFYYILILFSSSLLRNVTDNNRDRLPLRSSIPYVCIAYILAVCKMRLESYIH